MNFVLVELRQMCPQLEGADAQFRSLNFTCTQLRLRAAGRGVRPGGLPNLYFHACSAYALSPSTTRNIPMGRLPLSRHAQAVHVGTGASA